MFESYQENYTAPLGTHGDMFTDSNQKSVTDFHGASAHLPEKREVVFSGRFKSFQCSNGHHRHPYRGEALAIFPDFQRFDQNLAKSTKKVKLAPGSVISIS